MCVCVYTYCCSVAMLCPTHCDSVNCSMPDLAVLHYLPEFAQTHVHIACIYIYTHTHTHTHIYIYIYIYKYNLNDFGCKTYRKRTLPKPPLHNSTVHGTELSSNGTSPTGEKESKEWVSGYPRCMEHARRKPFLSSSINSTVLIPAVLTPSTVLMWGPPWLGGLPLWLSW